LLNVQNYLFPQIPVCKAEKHGNLWFHFSILILDMMMINYWETLIKFLTFFGNILLAEQLWYALLDICDILNFFLRPAIDGHKNSNLQTLRSLGSNLIFTYNLAESTKCFDYHYFKSTKVRKIKNWDCQNTFLTQLNSK
jgi:hypothetical protein